MLTISDNNQIIQCSTLPPPPKAHQFEFDMLEIKKLYFPVPFPGLISCEGMGNKATKCNPPRSKSANAIFCRLLSLGHSVSSQSNVQRALEMRIRLKG